MEYGDAEAEVAKGVFLNLNADSSTDGKGSLDEVGPLEDSITALPEGKVGILSPII